MPTADPRIAAAQSRGLELARRSDRPRQRRSAEPSDSPATIRTAARLSLRDAAGDSGLLHFHGVASVTETPYTMYDFWGPYEEVVAADAFDDTLNRADLDVPLVLSHDQLRRIARTTNGTLTLAATDEGLTVDAPALDPADADVAYIAPKLRAELVDEMSFAFRIDSGEWSPDWMTYRITKVDLHRGDVAIVGYGANPATVGGLRSPQGPGPSHRSLALALLALDLPIPTSVRSVPVPPPAPPQGPGEGGGSASRQPHLQPSREETSAMTMAELIAAYERRLTEAVTERRTRQDHLVALRSQLEAGDATITVETVQAARSAYATADAAVTERQTALDELRAEQARDAEVDRLSAIIVPTPTGLESMRTREQTIRIGAEERTYRPDTDRRGMLFASDVLAAFRGDFAARQRLDRHTSEERVERGADQFDTRAVGTGAFTGLVVPQYLVDEFAALPRADRPLADAMRHHDLPATGMTVNIGKITTGSTAAEQATENTAVSETDIDDTLLTLPVLTSAGSQTVSRQGSERGAGVEDTIIEDLISAQRANLDSILINRAVTGLTNIATSVAYTDATPTAAELYPKLLAGPAGVEAAMLNAHPGDVISVMHSRRWYWLQSQLSATWPLFGQPGVAPQLAGENYGTRYGTGFRGILPSGVPVVVDNNVGVLLGAGTEDEIYFVSQTESHLWEDPNAPVLIRAEQPKAKTLGIDLVVYAYFAYTFQRVPHAQKILGTGLIAPVFA